MIEIIGWIGTLGFALCGIPPAISAWRLKRSDLDNGLLVLWFLGEICTLSYVILTSMDLILLTNYTCNFICLCVIIFYKLRRFYGIKI